jgi:hypothetical protein
MKKLRPSSGTSTNPGDVSTLTTVEPEKLCVAGYSPTFFHSANERETTELEVTGLARSRTKSSSR